jgi:hypothetical protein
VSAVDFCCESNEMSHSHTHRPDGAKGHAHAHGPAFPHPAQAATWSVLRMALAGRLGAALAVSAGLWVIVLLATR